MISSQAPEDDYCCTGDDAKRINVFRPLTCESFFSRPQA